MGLVVSAFTTVTLTSVPPDTSIVGRGPHGASSFVVAGTVHGGVLNMNFYFLTVLVALVIVVGRVPTSLMKRTLARFFAVFIVLRF